MSTTPSTSTRFLDRHYFLLRRLMSLSGIVPIGAFLVFHLSANASVMLGPDVFERSVGAIDAVPKPLLAGLEIAFIFVPLAFHAVIGLALIRTAQSNVGAYRYGSNVRYTLQRITGVIAMLFILFHVITMHRWGLAWFKPHHAFASTVDAISGTWYIRAFYVVGVLCTVFHFANGVWTSLITWGITVGTGAQRNAGYACTALGIVLALMGVGALWGFSGPVEAATPEPAAALIESATSGAP